MLRYMLDTNICIKVIKERPKEVRQHFNDNADLLCISAITYFELVYSAQKSKQVIENLKQIESLSARLEILPFSDKAAAHAGQIKSELLAAETPIGAYDTLIAGHARSEALTLITTNEEDFKQIEGLLVDNWMA